MGLLHPRTHQMYQYAGLPMGSAASPALAGCYGTAFMRLLKERCSLFQGEARENTWGRSFGTNNPYNAEVRQGLVFERSDGLPALFLWANCNDFLIHVSTHKKTFELLYQSENRHMTRIRTHCLQNRRVAICTEQTDGFTETI
jgi:hypothetical protein